MGSTPTTICTTCGNPSYPHPYLHPITIHAKPPRPPEGPSGISPQPADTEPAIPTVSREDFTTAMRLLGLDPDNPERALLTVHIEDGRITATYGQINRVGSTPCEDS